MNRFLRLLRRLTSGIFVQQWFGNLAAVLLAFAWLQIPDSHSWQFVFGIVSGVLLVIAFLWLHAWTIQRLSGSAMHGALWRRLLLLALVIVAGYFLLQSVSSISDRVGLLAGYWNSKLPPGMRTFFTYQKLVGILGFACDALRWILVALLLPVMYEAGGPGFGEGARRRLRRVYRRALYWLGTILAGFAASHLIAAFVQWRPGTGITQEMASVILRVGVAYTICILLWCFILALIAAFSRHGAARESSDSH